MSISLNLALASCAILGFRHGFDYDHIAAIADITGVQTRASTAMKLGLLYALGHAATVAALGSAVIFLQLSLPPSADRWAERLVGITLILLAGYVLGSMILRRDEGHRHPKSRAMLLIGAFQWARVRMHSRLTGLPAPTPEPQQVNAPVAFGIGILHGLGAETPSQLAMFLLAANLGGRGKGLLGLAVFLAGLLTMNTLMTASAAGLFRMGHGHSGYMRVLTGITAVYSLAMGIVFLFGLANLLPNISG